MADANIKFDPDEIYGWAKSLEIHYKDLNDSFNIIKSKYQFTENQWKSASSDAFLEKANQLEQAKILILGALRENYEHLFKVSGLYGSAQGQAIRTSESLPVNGIFYV